MSIDHLSGKRVSIDELAAQKDYQDELVARKSTMMRGRERSPLRRDGGQKSVRRVGGQTLCSDKLGARVSARESAQTNWREGQHFILSEWVGRLYRRAVGYCSPSGLAVGSENLSKCLFRRIRGSELTAERVYLD